MAKHRPAQPILAVTLSEITMRRLNLVWGTYPLVKASPNSLEEWEGVARAVTVEAGLAKTDDVIVVTAGCLWGFPAVPTWSGC